MRIALVCNSYPPEFVGGVEMVVASQAQALRAAGHDVRVVCGSSERRADAKAFDETIRGVYVTRIPKTDTELASSHWLAPRITRLVAQAVDDCDLVHVHHWASLSGELVRSLAQVRPVVVTLHDAFASCPRFFRVPTTGIECPTSRPTDSCVQCVAPLVGDISGRELHRGLTERWENYRAELAAAAGVISPSHFLADAIAAALELDRSSWRVIPHGLCRDLRAAQQTERTDGPLTVISFGNRSEVKGTLDLVCAAAAAEPGTIRLLLPGAEVQPGFDDELRAAANGLELELPGRYDSEDLMKHAARADLAAFPSRVAESYGLVVEEALALGLPTWVSDRGALPEVLRQAANRGGLTGSASTESETPGVTLTPSSQAASQYPGGILPAECPAAWTRLFNELANNRTKLHDATHAVPLRRNPSERAVSQQLELYGQLLNRPLSSRL